MLYVFIAICVICAIAVHCIFNRWIVTFFASIVFAMPIIAVYLFNMKAEGIIAHTVIGIGYIILGFSIYFFGCVFTICIIRIFFKKLHMRKSIIYALPAVICTLVYGYFNVRNVHVNRIGIPSSLGMKIVFISDMHVGWFHSNELLTKLECLLIDEDIDLVILGGDIITYGFDRYKSEFVRVMKSIKAKHGIVAVLGNHEIYYGIERSINALKEAGINVLYDSYCCIDNRICILGRADLHDKHRKRIGDIYPQTCLPVLVVDHHPSDYFASSNAKAFIQLSGHTHAGQMFPNNLLQKYPNRKVFSIGDMYFYISSGFGVSSAPYRIWTTPEIVVFSLNR